MRQIFLRKFNSLPIRRFGQSVRVHYQNVPVVHLEAAVVDYLVEKLFRYHSERHSARLYRLCGRLCPRFCEQRRLVAGAGENGFARVGVDYHIYYGNEHIRAHRLDHLGVQRFQRLGGRLARHGDVPQLRLAQSHQNRRRNTLARNVADYNAHFAVGELEEVIEVAAD